MTYFVLSEAQKILFYSAMAAITLQTGCVYYFTVKKDKFEMDKCFGYLFFSYIAYFFYYKMIVSI
jgi:hypothetical protein